jgi:hypothetical protein
MTDEENIVSDSIENIDPNLAMQKKVFNNIEKNRKTLF